MPMLTRRHALGALGSAALLPLVPRIALAQEKTTIGALRFTSHAPNFVALERGYFRDEGLEVDLAFFQAAQPMAVAIASGDVDFGVTAITGGLISLAEKGAAKVIGGGLTEAKGIEGQKILASDAAYRAGLTSPAALDGKTFGMTQAGSSFHYMGAEIAAAEGVEMRFKPLQKVPAVIGALKSGQIDAWSIVPHIAKPLAASGAVHVIGAVSDYLPDYQVTTVFTSAETAAKEREKTAAFLRAFSRGAADYNAALVDRSAGDEAAEAMVALLAPYVYPDRPLEEARAPIVDGAMRINEGARLNEGSVRRQVEWFKAEGLVPGGVGYDTLVDPSYVETI